MECVRRKGKTNSIYKNKQFVVGLIYFAYLCEEMLSLRNVNKEHFSGLTQPKVAKAIVFWPYFVTYIRQEANLVRAQLKSD